MSLYCVTVLSGVSVSLQLFEDGVNKPLGEVSFDSWREFRRMYSSVYVVLGVEFSTDMTITLIRK